MILFQRVCIDGNQRHLSSSIINFAPSYCMKPIETRLICTQYFVKNMLPLILSNFLLTLIHTIIYALGHGDLTWKQGKSVQYDRNNFCLCRPGFHVPDISDSSRTVHIFDQVVTYRLRAA